MGAMLNRQRKATDVTADAWNTAFEHRCIDGSRISAITPSDQSGKSTITIDDPMRNAQLIVTIDENPYLFFDQVQDELCDPRIEQRIKDDINAPQNDHDFAKMLDYVIQCTGTLVPFSRSGRRQPNDLLIVYVKHIIHKH